MRIIGRQTAGIQRASTEYVPGIAGFWGGERDKTGASQDDAQPATFPDRDSVLHSIGGSNSSGCAARLWAHEKQYFRYIVQQRLGGAVTGQMEPNTIFVLHHA